MVQQRWHHSIICFVCKDHLPNYVRRVPVGEHKDGSPKFRCFDTCAPGSQKWLTYQKTLSKRSQFYKTFERAAKNRSESTYNSKKVREEEIKSGVAL